jgi:hypothetical protein
VQRHLNITEQYKMQFKIVLNKDIQIYKQLYSDIKYAEEVKNLGFGINI